MALNFVNGKPTKVKTVVQPATLEEAMTEPSDAVSTAEVKSSMLADMFNKKDPVDGGPMLPIKIKIDAVGHVENPVEEVHTFNPQTPEDVKLVKGSLVFTDPEMQAKLGGVQPYTDGGFESVDTVKLSEQQEPESEVSEELASSEVLALVDEYTALQKQIDAADISDLLKAQDVLKKSLQSIAKSKHYSITKPVRLMGTHTNYVEFSAPANSTKISDKPGLVAAIGVQQYIELTDITLANAKKVLPENVLGKYTTNVPGSRTLKTVHVGD